MYKEIIKWDIYEVQTWWTPITGVKFRGRVRKFCLERWINVLVENAQGFERCVRFAVIAGENVSEINEYLKKIVPDVKVEMVIVNVVNPVLSRLNINDENRYTLY